jgi:hypothetical protein
VDPYDVRAWTLVDSGADICIVRCDLFEIELDIHELNPGYFALKYIISIDMLMIPSSFVGVDGLTVEFQAKIVNRQSLPNTGVSPKSTPLSNDFLIFQLPLASFKLTISPTVWENDIGDPRYGTRLSRVLPKKKRFGIVWPKSGG